MHRSQKLFTAALLLSVAVHLSLLASAGRWWTQPAKEIPFPIEAELVEVKAPPAPVRPVKAAPRQVAAATPVPPPPPPVAEPPAPPAEPSLVTEPAASPPATAPVTPSAPVPVAAPAEAAGPAPVDLPLAARQLPAHLVLRYSVQYGDGGFNLGEATYTWQLNQDHYVLVSIAQPTGLVSMFSSARVVQSSEGQVTQYGLKPERFWMGRSTTRKESARFDWGRHQLALPSGEVALPELSQDMMSFIFHLAMTVRETDQEWPLAVTNGSRLKDYVFRNLGSEKIQVSDKEFEALHLQGTRANEGALELWLGMHMHWLPVRVRTVDNKGKAMVLNLIRVEG